MRLHLLDTGLFKLDGGAMFGVVPQSIWKKLNPPDTNNMCTWAMRSLLIEDAGKVILIDTGIGDKQDAKFFQYYYLHGEGSLLGSLNKIGCSPEQVTDVFHTHLHFDHVGGAVLKNGERFATTFSVAKYWSNSAHWQWATEPNPREKASFLKENILPIQDSGQLFFTDKDKEVPINFIEVSGHTEKMMLPKIEVKGKTIVFASDLIPSVGHIPLPYIMAYDVRPLLTMEEKRAFLQQAAKEGWVLVLQHDPVHECCTVKQTERGVVVDQTFPFSEISQ